jgi:hypothetical protein
MSTAGRVAVVGAGIVGVRVARELLTPMLDGDPGSPRVVVVTRRPERREQLSASFGSDAQVLLDAGGGLALPDDVSVVVVAREAGEHEAVVRAQIEAGRHVVSTSDDPDEVAALQELGDWARAVGLSLVLGATMSPGLSCLLAAHAATLMDRVDEVHVARHGVAGPACARQRLRALRGTALDWRDGKWARRPGFSGRELDWFPDPIGGRDCYRAELAEPLLLLPGFPDAQRVTARLAASRRDRALAPFPVLLPPPVEGGLGAVRVEVRGEVDGARSTVVYGALDRPATAAGAVAAVTALALLADGLPHGAAGLVSSGRHLEMLTELARRGVRAATFEGGADGALASSTGSDTAQSAQVPPRHAEEPHVE